MRISQESAVLPVVSRGKRGVLDGLSAKIKTFNQLINNREVSFIL